MSVQMKIKGIPEYILTFICEHTDEETRRHTKTDTATDTHTPHTQRRTDTDIDTDTHTRTNILNDVPTRLQLYYSIICSNGPYTGYTLPNYKYDKKS